MPHELRPCNNLQCQLIGFHTRSCARAAMREELRRANPQFTETDLNRALDDLDSMERSIHPEVDLRCPHCGAPVAEEGCSNGLCEAAN